MLSYDISQAAPNTVIVEVGKSLEDTVTFNGMTLHIDPEFNPTHHARIYGRVVAIPAGNIYDFNGNQIHEEVRIGDLVYFHYLTTSDESNCIYGNYYRVPYCWIFCTIRDGFILPVGGWTLCEKIIEDKFNKVDVGGHSIDAVISASGIVTKLNKIPSTKEAVLAHIGKPFVGMDELGVKSGDKVILAKNSNFVNNIEGIDYYTVRQEDILGKSEVPPPSDS
jgi:co-chaperonin GroES (HSP10)